MALILFFPCLALGASVTLSWNAPALSCDGSTLDDLAGYFVLWGLYPGTRSQQENWKQVSR